MSAAIGDSPTAQVDVVPTDAVCLVRTPHAQTLRQRLQRFTQQVSLEMGVRLHMYLPCFFSHGDCRSCTPNAVKSMSHDAFCACHCCSCACEPTGFGFRQHTVVLFPKFALCRKA